MTTFLKAAMTFALSFTLEFAAPLALAQELAPDVLVKTISEDVLAAIRQDKDIQAGNPKKIASLIEAKVSFDYEMDKTPSGWKVYDVKISGASLAATYRDTFAEEVRNRGIDGLIDLLSSKNRQGGPNPTSIKT